MSWPERLYNTGYVTALAAVERTLPFWPAGWIERRQRRRLRSLIRHAYATVPFYRRAMDERGLAPADFRTVADLARLPLLDDGYLRDNLEQLTSSRYPEGTREAEHSSGSQTGQRTTIYWDNASLLHKVAYAERDRAVLNELAGQGWGQSQVYILTPTSTSLRMRARWDRRLLVPRGLAERHYISPMQPFEAVVEQINAIRPAVIFTYGSYADAFVRFLLDSGQSIVPPRVWMYGGDLLSPSGRELLEKTVGCRVYSSYGAAEVGRVGFECARRQGFHLNVDLIAVRLIDEQGNTVPAGERGEVVVSNLHNRATVLLNYRLGDLAVMNPTPCPCGRSLPLLERLEGKRAEAVYLADGYSLSFIQIENACREELALTRAAQIVQPERGRVVWRIVPAGRCDRGALRAALVERTRALLRQGVEVSVEFVEQIPLTEGGKLKRVLH